MTTSNMPNISGFFYVALFVIIQILFQLKFFSFAFMILFGMILVVFFLKEHHRLFIWMTAGFFVGLLFFLYGDRILLALNFSQSDTLIFNRLLVFIPIIIMSYILYKFKRTFYFPLKKTKWEENIFNMSVRTLFLIITFLLLILSFISLLYSSPLNIQYIFKMILFSLLNGIGMEFLWRGILLDQLKGLVGTVFAIVVSSFSSVLFYYMFGFSLSYCFFFFFLFLLFGAVTIKGKSLFPSVVWHSLITLILLFSKKIPFVL